MQLLIVPVLPATIVRSIPVASHTLSLVAPADASLFGNRLGNEIMQSIWNFEFENGRRYHGYKAGSYPLPNDEVRATTHLSQMTHCTALSGVKSRLSLTPGKPMLNNMGKYHTGGTRTAGHQTPCHDVALRRPSAFCTSRKSWKDPGYWNGLGYLGNADGRTVPRILGDWDRSLSCPTRKVRAYGLDERKK